MISQNGQAHSKNLTAFTDRYLSGYFETLRIKRLIIMKYAHHSAYELFI